MKLPHSVPSRKFDESNQHPEADFTDRLFPTLIPKTVENFCKHCGRSKWSPYKMIVLCDCNWCLAK